jgi:hypothetical protein
LLSQADRHEMTTIEAAPAAIAKRAKAKEERFMARKS